jgi:hypothetical protein
MSECCICFESEDVEQLECCGGFLHERCKQRWFLETRNCPLCRSFECRPQAAPLDLPPEVPRAIAGAYFDRDRGQEARIAALEQEIRIERQRNVQLVAENARLYAENRRLQTVEDGAWRLVNRFSNGRVPATRR